MNDDEVKKIVDFINSKYDEEIPGPVKFVIRRKTKKIERLDPLDFPEYVRKCTVEDLILIIKDAHEKRLLKF